jgi:glutathione peroxidase
VLGFPANDFKEQENGADEEIGRFCKINYGVTFTLFRKSSVIKGNDQNEVYRWLSDKNLNGWNDQEPTWNFAKYLVNEEGFLMHFFPPYVSPLSKSVLDAIEAE